MVPEMLMTAPLATKISDWMSPTFWKLNTVESALPSKQANVQTFVVPGVMPDGAKRKPWILVEFVTKTFASDSVIADRSA